MNLKKVWLIAKREYLYNFKRRSFLFTAFFMPLFSIFMTGVIIAFAANQDADMGNVKAIGIVDQVGILSDSSGKLLIDPPTPFVIVASEDQAKSELSSKALDGYYVINQAYRDKNEIKSYSPASLPSGIEPALSSYLKLAIAAQSGNADITLRLQDPLAKRSIYRLSNPDVPLDTIALVGSFILPFIVGLLIFMSTMTTSQFLMGGVAEEKENRMMELIMTSVRPSEMLWGKLLGLGALGISQLLIWAAAATGIGLTRGGVDFARILGDLEITPVFLILILVYFILSYLLIGTFMAAVGVMGDNEQEGRQLAGLVALPSILPFIFSFTFVSDPNGGLATFLSMFPLTAPVSMILRMVWGTPSTLQIIASVGILFVTMVGMVWLTGRIFRLGMLSYGKRLSIRDIIQALREGRQHIVVDTTTAQTKGA